MSGINFYEFSILVVLALVLVGPERLPQCAQNLARWVRRARSMAEDARIRFKDETGADFGDVDWHKYHPRQYDPRRIIREALAEDYDEVRSEVRSLGKQVDPRELFAPVDSAAAGESSRSGGALAAGVLGSAVSTAAAVEVGDDRSSRAHGTSGPEPV